MIKINDSHERNILVKKNNSYGEKHLIKVKKMTVMVNYCDEG